MLSGVWDLFLPVPYMGMGDRCIFNGLYIEMKTAKGTLSTTQKWYRDQLNQWYRFEVIRDWRDGRDLLLEYIGTTAATDTDNKDVVHG
jgi:hypothetical protein